MENKKVFVLIEIDAYDNTIVRGVTSSLDKAQTWTEDQVKKVISQDKDFVESAYIELPRGYKYLNQSFVYLEFDFK
jgi:beta-N-acetylglucosaminidase